MSVKEQDLVSCEGMWRVAGHPSLAEKREDELGPKNRHSTHTYHWNGRSQAYEYEKLLLVFTGTLLCKSHLSTSNPLYSIVNVTTMVFDP